MVAQQLPVKIVLEKQLQGTKHMDLNYLNIKPTFSMKKQLKAHDPNTMAGIAFTC